MAYNWDYKHTAFLLSCLSWDPWNETVWNSRQINWFFFLYLIEISWKPFSFLFNFYFCSRLSFLSVLSSIVCLDKFIILFCPHYFFTVHTCSCVCVYRFVSQENYLKLIRRMLAGIQFARGGHFFDAVCLNFEAFLALDSILDLKFSF